jgi:hypothetical protein
MLLWIIEGIFLLPPIPNFPTITPSTTSIIATTNDRDNNHPHMHDDVATTVATSAFTTTTQQSLSEFPDFLQKYIHFHKQSIHFNARGKSSLRSSSTPFLLYSCRSKQSTCGGLGDRINGILTAFYIAMCNQRVFLIDWEQDSVSDYLLPNQILYTIDRPVPYQVRIHTIDQTNHPVLLQPRILSQRPEYVNATGIAIQANVWIGTVLEQPSQSQSCWQQPPSSITQKKSPEKDTDHDRSIIPSTSDALFQWGFHTLFQFSHRVIDRANTIRQSVHLTMPYVAMHIRTGIIPGDVVQRHTDPHEWHQFITCGQTMQRALEQKCGGDKEYDLYLAADHDDVKEYAISIDNSIKTIRHLPIFHHDKQDYIRTQPPDDTTTRTTSMEEKEGEWAVFSELYVLHQATCLITSRSKYSDLAARLQETHCSIRFDKCHDDDDSSNNIHALLESLNASVLCRQQQKQP